jgi:hypothetical protein
MEECPIKLRLCEFYFDWGGSSDNRDLLLWRRFMLAGIVLAWFAVNSDVVSARQGNLA